MCKVRHLFQITENQTFFAILAMNLAIYLPAQRRFGNRTELHEPGRPKP